MRWRTTAIPGRWWWGGAGGRSARSARSAAGPRAPDEIASSLVALVDRVTRRLRTAERVCRTVVAPCAVLGLHARDALADVSEPTAQTHIVLRPRRICSPVDADDQAAWRDADRHHADEPRGRRGCDPARSSVQPGQGSRHRARSGRDRFGSQAITRGVLVGKDPGISVPRCPTDRPCLCSARRGDTWPTIARG